MRVVQNLHPVRVHRYVSIGSYRYVVSFTGRQQTSLKLAAKHGIRSIAFLSISTGVYSYPLKQAAEIAVWESPEAFDEILWVLFDKQIKAAYDEALSF